MSATYKHDTLHNHFLAMIVPSTVCVQSISNAVDKILLIKSVNIMIMVGLVYIKEVNESFKIRIQPDCLRV